MRSHQEITQGEGFVEIADRCWVARYDFLDVNVGVIAGERGLLVVDTHASEAEAARVVQDVRRLVTPGAREIVAVVNTHHHFDHTFGNIVFAEEHPGIELIAHEAAAEALTDAGRVVQAEAAAYDEAPDSSNDGAGGASDAADELRRNRDVAATRLLVPDQTFSSARVVDLGDRLVELIHPGRGHTAGDVIVRVPDADVVYAGDLVEESALRGGVPGFGADCFPMEWPGTLDFVISMLTERSVVVPGHGRPVDQDFVFEQRGSIGMVAETIRDLAGRGIGLADALTSAQWPYPVTELTDAVARAYEHLPRDARTLPLA